MEAGCPFGDEDPVDKEEFKRRDPGVLGEMQFCVQTRERDRSRHVRGVPGVRDRSSHRDPEQFYDPPER